MKSLILFALLAVAFSEHGDVGIIYTAKEVVVEASCRALFYELDRRFSDMIFVHNATTQQYLDDLAAIENLISPDFIYVINGHTIPFSGIDEGVQQMFSIYSFRQTRPPLAMLFPLGFYDDHNKLARLHSVVSHDFVNATGTFTDFNLHQFYCQKTHGSWVMLNATLTRYNVIAS